MPPFRVDIPVLCPQNVGMPRRSADKSGQRRGSVDLGAIRAGGGLGAFFSPTQAEEAGLSRERLRTLVRRGSVEHVGRGLYRVSEAEPTQDYSLAMACTRVPNGIVCLLSALRVHEIGTQSPAEVWIAIPHKARAPRLYGLHLRVVRFSGSAWSLGVEETTFEGVPGRITSPARTIVDCFRFERLIGVEVAIEALQDGLRQRKVTVAELSRIEQELPSRRLSAALDLLSI